MTPAHFGTRVALPGPDERGLDTRLFQMSKRNGRVAATLRIGVFQRAQQNETRLLVAHAARRQPTDHLDESGTKRRISLRDQAGDGIEGSGPDSADGPLGIFAGLLVRQKADEGAQVAQSRRKSRVAHSIRKRLSDPVPIEAFRHAPP